MDQIGAMPPGAWPRMISPEATTARTMAWQSLVNVAQIASAMLALGQAVAARRPPSVIRSEYVWYVEAMVLGAVRVVVARVPVLYHSKAGGQPGPGSSCCNSSHTGRAATSRGAPAAAGVSDDCRDSSTVILRTGALSA